MNPANPQHTGTGGGGQRHGGNPVASVNSPGQQGGNGGGGQGHGGNPVAPVNSPRGGGQGHGGNPVAPVNSPPVAPVPPGVNPPGGCPQVCLSAVFGVQREAEVSGGWVRAVDL